MGQRPSTSFLEASQCYASLSSCNHVNQLDLCFEVAAPGVSKLPSFHISLIIPGERLPCIGCRLTKGVVNPSLM
ncbi:hypothetical protein DPMN_136191 [Dreissena polymorpha]|uniref:Uncharacterized protein n=1 Tax=Dreissena polymorpha TaxID=45954 RepID=A0A9D4JFB3_DREPO|nr:hypothetical protein DPMN_136191 [Dreissena polymorpha]